MEILRIIVDGGRCYYRVLLFKTLGDKSSHFYHLKTSADYIFVVS